MTDDERRQELAVWLGYDPAAPETWPDKIIRMLMRIWDARGWEAVTSEIRRMTMKG